MTSHELQPFLQKAESSMRAAQFLLQQGFYESGISRAYYAVFVGTSVLLVQKIGAKVINWRTGRIEWKHETVHNSFIEHFYTRQHIFTKEEVEAYSKLKLARETVDYSLGRLEPKRVERLLTSAQELHDKIVRLVTDEKQNR